MINGQAATVMPENYPSLFLDPYFLNASLKQKGDTCKEPRSTFLQTIPKILSRIPFLTKNLHPKID